MVKTDTVEMVSRPSYYAIIPADVRYDDRISDKAKLLYGEISALVGVEGFCFANNAYFSRLYMVTERTVSASISSLQKHGYIDVIQEKDPKTGQVIRRKIYLKVSSCDERPVEEIFYTPRKYFREGIEKIFQDTDLSNTVINPPISPPVGGDPPKKKKGRSRDYKAQAETLPERFEKFWTFYRTHMPPDCNAGNRQKAIRAWDNLAPGNELVTTMALALAKQVKSQSWATGVGVPHASTWLSNHGWEDDWGPAAGSKPEQVDSTGDEEAVEWVH